MAVTETWLQPDVPDAYVQVDGFTLVRADRDLVRSGKSCGGGVCAYINDRWCGCITVRETISDRDMELLCISLRPFYLPREFGNVVICVIYVPPDGNA